jgi:RNA:NAD 2'-phosphotransferase (TPT1/KptA family)
MVDYYHVTDRSNVEAIRKKGLIAKRDWYGGRRVWLHSDLEEAHQMASFTRFRDPVILRVRLPKSVRTERKNIIEPYYSVKKSIPPKRITVMRGKGKPAGRRR